MALDEAISEAVRKKHSPPTLRLYQWVQASVSIGYFQNISDINLVYCREKKIPIVRRLTGGKAVLHDSELTYSFTARFEDDPFKNNIMKNYLLISKALQLALTFISLDTQINFSNKIRQKSSSCFNLSSYGEISIKGEKIIGGAQKQYQQGFLQQGSILMDLNAKELGSVLKKDTRQNTYDKIGTIKKHAPSVSVQELKKAVKDAFEQFFDIILVYETPTHFESNLAGKLEREKYSTENWIFSK
jgi:lipoate-protein ligase A